MNNEEKINYKEFLNEIIYEVGSVYFVKDNMFVEDLDYFHDYSEAVNEFEKIKSRIENVPVPYSVSIKELIVKEYGLEMVKNDKIFKNKSHKEMMDYARTRIVLIDGEVHYIKEEEDESIEF